VGAAPTTVAVRRRFAEVLAEVVGRDQVPVDGHFFDDLDANSLVMAHFCARVRKRDDLPSVSMKDIYRHPTVRRLAEALANTAAAPVEPRVPEVAEPPASVTTALYHLCGTRQLLIFLGYSCAAVALTLTSADWISAAAAPVQSYERRRLRGCGLRRRLLPLPGRCSSTAIERAPGASRPVA